MHLSLVVTFFIVSLALGEDIHEEIYYGSNASKGQFKFMARLYFANKDTATTNSYAICGGSLINSRWIASAAHCAVGAVSMIAYLGWLDLNDQTGTVRYSIPGSNIHSHPSYNPRGPSPDLVLCKLPSDAPTDNPNIQPIAISPRIPVNQYDNKIVQIIGWGQTQSGHGADILQWANAKVLSTNECKAKFPPGATDATICTDNNYNGVSVCSGDSGGPLTYTANGQTTLVGITSVAVGAPPCSDRNGGNLYTYAVFYIDWINYIISTN